MKAIILAGGKGTRLMPYTTVLPKPLMPIGDRPILEIVIRQLRKHGFRDIIISTGHLAELIQAYFGDGKRFGVRIKYVYETKPLSTAGALKLIRELPENFLVMNGDILCNINYSKFMRIHIQRKNIVTICIKPQTTQIDYGIIEIDHKNNLSKYIEKPLYNFFVSTGIYAMNRKCVNYIKKNEVISMPDLMKRMIDKKQSVRCEIHNGFWLDIGRHDDYRKANGLAEKGKLKNFLE